jgi:lipopolysaccharide export system protein LptC
MAGAENRYSTFIGWAKITLPLAALALLSTFFLFSRGANDGERIPLSDIAAIAREPRISSPTFAGVATDGSVVSLSAAEIRPIADRPDSFAITSARLNLVAVDGSRIDLSAGAGEIDAAGRTAVFSDRVHLTTSTGYMIETSGARADLRAGTIESDGPLTASGPFGRLDAGRVLFSADPESKATRLLFDGGVRLLYDPRS